MLAAQIFNALEAAFWFALAALALVFGSGVRGFTPWRKAALAGFLAAFGCSDLWEIACGWSQPPSLFAFKGFCLAGLAVTAWRIFSARWRAAADA
jgi:hypothetical protein